MSVRKHEGVGIPYLSLYMQGVFIYNESLDFSAS